MLLGQVARPEPLHGRDERRHVARHLESIAIGAPLVCPGQRVGQRAQRDRRRSARKREKRQRGNVRLARNAETANARGQYEVGKKEAERHQRRFDRNAGPHIAMHVMRELVREDDLDLIIGVIGQQRVGQEDAAGASEPGERRVRLARAVAQPPLEDAQHLCPGSLRERHQTVAKRRTVQRLEIIKNRQQHHRRELREDDHQYRKRKGRYEPPVFRSRT